MKGVSLKSSPKRLRREGGSLLSRVNAAGCVVQSHPESEGQARRQEGRESQGAGTLRTSLEKLSVFFLGPSVGHTDWSFKVVVSNLESESLPELVQNHCSSGHSTGDWVSRRW